MREFRGQPGLALEALEQFGIFDQLGVNDLDDHGAVEQAVLGLEHGPHAAAAELSHDLVARMVQQLLWHLRRPVRHNRGQRQRTCGPQFGLEQVLIVQAREDFTTLRAHGDMGLDGGRFLVAQMPEVKRP